MEGVLSLEPLEQSVLDTLLVAQPMEGIMETDPPERSALASQLDYGQSNLESPARPMLNITQDEITDRDTDPSERSALATHLEYGLVKLKSMSRPMLDVALDRRPMEGITVPLPVESLGLAMAQAVNPWNTYLDLDRWSIRFWLLRGEMTSYRQSP